MVAPGSQSYECESVNGSQKEKQTWITNHIWGTNRLKWMGQELVDWKVI